MAWTFITSHGLVLLAIARDPDVRLREVAEMVGLTERAVQRIVRQLVDAGYSSGSEWTAVTSTSCTARSSCLTPPLAISSWVL